MAALTFPSPTQLKNISAPTDNTDAATKIYVDNVISSGSAVAAAAGSNNQIQYNSNGVLGASSNFTFDSTTSLLTITGDSVITGNLNVGGNVQYVNVTNLYVKDALIEQGGGANSAALTANDGKDRGTLLHYYTTTPVDAFMGWQTANSEFVFSSNASVSNNLVTVNSLGNVRASFFIGNGSSLTGVAASSSTTAGTVTSNAQPNITSLGTLVSLTVAGPVNLGNIGNITINGGSNGQVITTNGSGVLTFNTPVVPALSATVDEFTGNGIQTAFTLSVTPTGKNYTFAVIQGIMQPKSSYTVAGAVLTFSSAPPDTALVEVTTMGVS
jgi:hypothetical protein